MSREIKFRLWDNNKNKMYYGGELDGTDTRDGIFVGAAYDNEEERLLSETCRCVGGDWQGSYWETGEVIEQYTGLVDKNGKEIYEGDIIQEKIDFNSKMTDGIFRYRVYWDNDTLAWSLDPIDGESIHHDLWETNQSREVIGNIHEPIDKNDQVC